MDSATRIILLNLSKSSFSRIIFHVSLITFSEFICKKIFPLRRLVAPFKNM